MCMLFLLGSQLKAMTTSSESGLPYCRTAVSESKLNIQTRSSWAAACAASGKTKMLPIRNLRMAPSCADESSRYEASQTDRRACSGKRAADRREGHGARLSLIRGRLDASYPGRAALPESPGGAHSRGLLLR